MSWVGAVPAIKHRLVPPCSPRPTAAGPWSDGLAAVVHRRRRRRSGWAGKEPQIAERRGQGCLWSFHPYRLADLARPESGRVAVGPSCVVAPHARARFAPMVLGSKLGFSLRDVTHQHVQPDLLCGRIVGFNEGGGTNGTDGKAAPTSPHGDAT